MVNEELRILLMLLFAWVSIFIIGSILPIKKYGFEFNPLYIIYKTKIFNNLLKKVSYKNVNFWNIFSKIAITIAIGEMFFAFYSLIININNFITSPTNAQPVLPIIPGITISTKWFPFFLLAIGLAIVLHEAAHGIVAIIEKIKINSTGIIFMPITFGAFVEQDNDSFDKSSFFSKLKLVSSGSLANLLVGVLSIILLSSLFLPASGILVTNVSENSSAKIQGVQPFDVIWSINSTRIYNTDDFNSFFNKKNSGEVILNTSAGIKILTSSNDSTQVIGIIGTNYHPMKFFEFSTFFSYNLITILDWISLIMINLAIFNMLPIYYLDGDVYISIILKKFFPKIGKKIHNLLNFVSLTLIIVNIFLSIQKFGLILI